jgi:RHS repeat-associated protein
MTDANGLEYMRARYYSPNIARFINQDVVLGAIDPGVSMNRFAYANGDPINNNDPLGLCSNVIDGKNSNDYPDQVSEKDMARLEMIQEDRASQEAGNIFNYLPGSTKRMAGVLFTNANFSLWKGISESFLLSSVVFIKAVDFIDGESSGNTQEDINAWVANYDIAVTDNIQKAQNKYNSSLDKYELTAARWGIGVGYILPICPKVDKVAKSVTLISQGSLWKLYKSYSLARSATPQCVRGLELGERGINIAKIIKVYINTKKDISR